MTACCCEIAYRRGGIGGLMAELREEIAGNPLECGLLVHVSECMCDMYVYIYLYTHKYR